MQNIIANKSANKNKFIKLRIYLNKLNHFYGFKIFRFFYMHIEDTEGKSGLPFLISKFE